MRTAVVVPSRYASTRLPGKPLLRAGGRSLIEHVWHRACDIPGADRVVVATDDGRIFDEVRRFGGEAVMTSPDHASGTDRVAEVARSLDADLLVNVQGDEPEIEANAVADLIAQMRADPAACMGTLAVPLRSVAAWRNPNVVKIVRDGRGRAIYFSRSPVPFVRDGEPDLSSGLFWHHLGVYAYRREALLELAAAPPHPLEEAEKLEQLRAVALGWSIRVAEAKEARPGIDTPADWERFRSALEGRAA